MCCGRTWESLLAKDRLVVKCNLTKTHYRTLGNSFASSEPESSFCKARLDIDQGSSWGTIWLIIGWPLVICHFCRKAWVMMDHFILRINNSINLIETQIPETTQCRRHELKTDGWAMLACKTRICIALPGADVHGCDWLSQWKRLWDPQHRAKCSYHPHALLSALRAWLHSLWGFWAVSRKAQVLYYTKPIRYSTWDLESWNFKTGV